MARCSASGRQGLLVGVGLLPPGCLSGCDLQTPTAQPPAALEHPPTHPPPTHPAPNPQTTVHPPAYHPRPPTHTPPPPRGNLVESLDSLGDKEGARALLNDAVEELRGIAAAKEAEEAAGTAAKPDENDEVGRTQGRAAGC